MPHPLPKFGSNSEYGPLQAVLLHRPGREIAEVKSPAAVQHLRKINAETMDHEYLEIIRAFGDAGIQVYFIDPQRMGSGTDRYLFNLMYVRDLLFMTPQGAVLCQMEGTVRRDEVIYAERTLLKIGIPIAGAVELPGTFEGADALWLGRNTVIVGVGNRTNEEGFNQLKTLLQAQRVEVFPAPVPKDAQHLLGLLQIVDRDLALVRSGRADPEIKRILNREGITAVDVPEDEETVEKQAMNVVTIAPRKILMASGCPKTAQLYRKRGIEVAGEIAVTQLINGGGGLACATGILARGLAPQ